MNDKVQSDLDGVDETYTNYLIRFTINGAVGIVKTWFENDLHESPREIAKIIDDITSRILDI